MTVQYAQQNINNPGKARIVDGDDVITLDDDVIEIDSGNPNLLLPDARTIPSKELVIKSSSGTGTVFGDPGARSDNRRSGFICVHISERSPVFEEQWFRLDRCKHRLWLRRVRA